MAETNFTNPYGTVILGLHSEDVSGALRAWDSADEYILAYLHENSGPNIDGLAVFNDKRGGLAVPLFASPVTVYTDSFTSRQGILKNLELNGFQADGSIFADNSAPVHPVSQVLIKIPDSLDLLEHQLRLVRRFADSSAIVIGAGMTRHIHTSTIACFEKILGTTTSSLARKKARLIFCTPDHDKTDLPNEKEAAYLVDGIPEPLINLPGVFSRHRQDPGTRFFLDHLKLDESWRQIADFGCGNGILGIRAALHLSDSRVTMIDDSAAAVASAEENIRRNGLECRVSAVHGMSLNIIEPASLDLVLSNPPFHQGRATSLDTAFSLIDDSHEKLKPGGELQIVANTHLGYHRRIQRIFGNIEIIADNGRYVILRGKK